MFDDIAEKSNYKLLYAEDEPEVRIAYKTFFEDYFKEVIVVKNGDDAWEQYVLNKPSIVVLDIKMPGLNGIEVAQKIRKNDKDAILIIMTANDTKEWLYQSIELGLTKFIKKGTKKFTEFEKILLDVIKELDERNSNMEENDTIWMISPRDSEIEIYWDTLTHKLFKNGEPVDLSQQLTRLINYFSLNKGRIISHEEFAKELWGNETDSGKTSSDQKIRAYLYTIKEKVGVELFKSHYKQGYSLEMQE